MSILICSTEYGGCGFIGDGATEFHGDGDFVMCSVCGEDHAFQLTKENLDSLTNGDVASRELGRLLIANDPSVVGLSRCGCVYHAEEGRVCLHDVAIARERLCANAFRERAATTLIDPAKPFDAVGIGQTFTDFFKK